MKQKEQTNYSQMLSSVDSRKTAIYVLTLQRQHQDTRYSHNKCFLFSFKSLYLKVLCSEVILTGEKIPSYQLKQKNIIFWLNQGIISLFPVLFCDKHLLQLKLKKRLHFLAHQKSNVQKEICARMISVCSSEGMRACNWLICIMRISGASGYMKDRIVMLCR